MPDINELKVKRDELFALLANEQEQITVLQEHYHQVSLCKDEVLRQIAELEEGPKPIAPPTLAAVAAEIAAKKVVAEPAKEIVEP